MAASVVWGLGAEVMAAAAGSFLVQGLTQSVKRRRAVMNVASGGWAARMQMLLIGGVRPLLRPSKKLLEMQAVSSLAKRAQTMLEERGSKANEEALVSLLIAASAASLLLGFALSGSIVFGVTLACIAVMGSAGYVRTMTDRTIRQMREDVPEVIRCMQTCFRSGQSLLQTLAYTSQEVGGALGKVFSVAAKRLKMGDTTQSALGILRKYPEVPELTFVAVALDVQHQTGGSIVPVLESARESVEGELELMRTLRVQTAQAKLSATIVTIMPFVLIALFSLMSPDFLSPFFSSWQGVFMLGLALAMQLAGVISVRHMLKIDVS